MNDFSTPKKCIKNDVITIPASPFLQELGYGTGVQVYKFLRSPKSNCSKSPWAVKMVNSRTKNTLYCKRLREEATLLRRMNHPYIVEFRQFSKNLDGKDCLAMEECSSALGDLIENRLEQYNHAFSPDKIIKVALHISKALDYLHVQMLLLHADIKSLNILINGDFDVCKLCDFGVSLPLNANGDLDLEKTDAADKGPKYVGTVCWSAPEVLHYPQRITCKADIFSFGLVLWEMMALDVPHSAKVEDLSDENLDLSAEEAQYTYGTRPPVPVHMMGDDIESYNHVLEIFYCCTEFDLKNRPTAQHLSLCIEKIITDK